MEIKIGLALQIWHSQTPLMLLNSGGFLFYIIYSPQFSFKKLLILMWSISWNARVSSVDAPTRFEPLPDLIILTITYAPHLLKIMMNDESVNQCSESTQPHCIWPALLDRQVYRAPYLSTSFWPSFRRNEPNKSTSQCVNGASLLLLSLGKSVIFCCWSLTLDCLQLTHFKMIHLTRVTSCHPKMEGLYLFHCHVSTSMGYLFMTPV